MRTFEIELPEDISIKELKGTIEDLRCVGCPLKFFEKVSNNKVIVSFEDEDWTNSWESVGFLDIENEDNAKAFEEELQGQFIQENASKIKVKEILLKNEKEFLNQYPNAKRNTQYDSLTTKAYETKNHLWLFGFDGHLAFKFNRQSQKVEFACEHISLGALALGKLELE